MSMTFNERLIKIQAIANQNIRQLKVALNGQFAFKAEERKESIREDIRDEEAILALIQHYRMPITPDDTYMGHRLGDLIEIARLYEAQGNNATTISKAYREGYLAATSRFQASLEMAFKNTIGGQHGYDERIEAEDLARRFNRARQAEPQVGVSPEE